MRFPPTDLSRDSLGPALARRGWLVLDDVLSPAECSSFVRAIVEYEKTGRMRRVIRTHIPGPCAFWTCMGSEVEDNVPGAKELLAGVHGLVNRVAPRRYAPMEGRGINVNITDPDDEVGFHYDEQEISAVLYLNAVEGGAFDLYPRSRLPVRDRWAVARRALRHLPARLLRASTALGDFARYGLIEPRAGRLLIMEASVSLHGVRMVTGSERRFSMVMAFQRE